MEANAKVDNWVLSPNSARNIKVKVERTIGQLIAIADSVAVGGQFASP